MRLHTDRGLKESGPHCTFFRSDTASSGTVPIYRVLFYTSLKSPSIHIIIRIAACILHCCLHLLHYPYQDLPGLLRRCLSLLINLCKQLPGRLFISFSLRGLDVLYLSVCHLINRSAG